MHAAANTKESMGENPVTDTVKGGNGWHLDKRVPIALILVILAQTAGGAWWAATTSARVDANAKAVMKVDDDTANIPERLSRMETRQEYILQTIERIDRKLENGGGQ